VNQEIPEGATDNSAAHPFGYFCHYAMAWNKDGELAKHWVTYFDKISTRLSKGLEKCPYPRKVKEKHPVKRIDTEKQKGPSLRATASTSSAGADREDANGLVEIT